MWASGSGAGGMRSRHKALGLLLLWSVVHGIKPSGPDPPDEEDSARPP